MKNKIKIRSPSWSKETNSDEGGEKEKKETEQD